MADTNKNNQQSQVQGTKNQGSKSNMDKTDRASGGTQEIGTEQEDIDPAESQKGSKFNR